MNLDRHCQIVDEVLELLARESYFLRPSKCVFEQTHIEYLGLVVDGGQLTIDPVKASGLKDWPRNLTKVKQVRSVLGVLGYQRPFIPNYASIAKPLTDLTRKDHPFEWTPQCRNALDTLINIILSNPSLRQPDCYEPDNGVLLLDLSVSLNTEWSRNFGRSDIEDGDNLWTGLGSRN